MEIVGLIVALLGLIGFLAWKLSLKNKGDQAMPPPVKTTPEVPLNRPEPLTAAERKAANEKSFNEATGSNRKSAVSKKAEPKERAVPTPVAPNPTAESPKPKGDYVAAIITVESEDPIISKAIDSARSNWSEFETHFRQMEGDTSTLAKFAFPFEVNGKSGREHMWIKVAEIAGEEVKGELLNAPIHRTDLQEGQAVSCQLSALSDWLIQDGETSRGAYTDQLFREQV